MADRVETFAVGCSGGLVTNQPTLAQAAQMPGTARELINFEPSVEGGYRRINGYAKWSTTPISALPVVWTMQPYTIGATSMYVGGWYQNIDTAGSGSITFVLSGTTYTVTSITPDFSSPYESHATITFTPSLSVNLTTGREFIFLRQNYFTINTASLFTVGSTVITIGEAGNIVKNLNNIVYLSLGDHASGNYFYSRVDGAGQTGTALTIKNVKHRPQEGDTFWISGSLITFPGLFVISSVGSYTEATGTATINIYPALPSSPANETLIQWVKRTRNMSSYSGRLHSRYAKGTNKFVAYPAGSSYPLLFNEYYYEPITQLYDIINSTSPVNQLISSAYYKSHLFFASLSRLYFSAPFNELDFSPANGAGEIVIPGTIVGIVSLRDSLIIFCKENIHRLVGTDAGNFSIQTVTKNTGCISGQSIQEINGDVMYLSDTGLSKLSDTDQQSGLGISVISNTIKTEINDLISPYVANTLPITSYPSVFSADKGMYRIFKYSTNTSAANTIGIVGAQVSLNPNEIQWSTLKGIRPTTITVLYDYSLTTQDITKILFISDNGFGATTYIYQLDSGDTFDGTNITATYSTPYYHINDPRVRKAFLNLETTVEPEGAVTITVDTILNYNKSDVIQPPAVVIGTTGTTYGDNTSPSYVTPLIGNGDVVSLKFTSNTNIPPYVIQSFTIEYSTNDRR